MRKSMHGRIGVNLSKPSVTFACRKDHPYFFCKLLPLGYFIFPFLFQSLVTSLDLCYFSSIYVYQ